MANTTLTPNAAAAAMAGQQAGNFPSSAFLYVTEFAAPQTNPMAPTYPPSPSLADQVVPFGGASSVSAPFGPATRLIRIQTTAVATVKIGIQPAAIAGPIGATMRMAANQAEYFSVRPGDQIAVVAAM